MKNFPRGTKINTEVQGHDLDLHSRISLLGEDVGLAQNPIPLKTLIKIGWIKDGGSALWEPLQNIGYGSTYCGYSPDSLLSILWIDVLRVFSTSWKMWIIHQFFFFCSGVVWTSLPKLRIEDGFNLTIVLFVWWSQAWINKIKMAWGTEVFGSNGFGNNGHFGNPEIEILH